MGPRIRSAGRHTNVALLIALLAAFATGWTAFAAGTGWGGPVVSGHAATGLAILVLAPWKSVIARRGLARERTGKPSSLILTLLVVVCLVAGILHSFGATRAVAGLTTMQLHVGAALATIPFAIGHLARRRTPIRRTDLSRRNVVGGLGVLGGGLALYGAFEALSAVLGLAGSKKRFTGSYELGSHDPDRMPVTQWLNDSVPSVDPARWRLSVRSRAGERSWSYAELAGQDVQVTATLDCTGGWYAQQEWSGVPLRALLEGAEGRTVMVRSVTGYARRFPIRDVDNLLLAVGAAGSPLTEGHGFPVRLVAPGRRGFWWVKWVDLIEVDDRPWWLQLPFPAE